MQSITRSPIKDDPVTGSNTRGTFTFATAGPNTRTSQVFINFGNNSKLDAMGFAPVREVIYGLEIAEAAQNPTPGVPGRVNQTQYEKQGNGYPAINFILVTTIDEKQH